MTDAINTEAFVLISSPSGWFGDWHPSPTRQYIFMISGELEAEVSDGEIRRFKKGDVTRVVSEQRVYCIAITLGSSSKAAVASPVDLLHKTALAAVHRLVLTGYKEPLKWQKKARKGFDIDHAALDAIL